MTALETSKRMALVHSSDTKPEVILRHSLWCKGFRYRVNDKRLPGKPDIVFPKYRTVIFVHGCFWHGHKGCKNYTIPKTNTVFWINKVERNQERDQEVWRQLEARGWSVIIVWECELKKKRFVETIDRVEKQIIDNGESFRSLREGQRRAREEYRQVRKAQKEKELSLLKEARLGH